MEHMMDDLTARYNCQSVPIMNDEMFFRIVQQLVADDGATVIETKLQAHLKEENDRIHGKILFSKTRNWLPCFENIPIYLGKIQIPCCSSWDYNSQCRKFHRRLFTCFGARVLERIKLGRDKTYTRRAGGAKLYVEGTNLWECATSPVLAFTICRTIQSGCTWFFLSHCCCYMGERDSAGSLSSSFWLIVTRA